VYRVKTFQSVLRKLALTISISAVSAYAAFAQQATEPAIFEYARTSLRGIVSAEFHRSVVDCRQICEARNGCVGFDYPASSNMCRMFAAVESAQQDNGSVAGTRHRIPRYRDPDNLPAPSAPPPPPPTAEAEVWHYAQFSDIDFYGGDLDARGIEVSDAASCARRCELDSSCKAFTYNQAQRYCFLKSGYQFVQSIDRGVSGLYFKARPSMSQIQINIDWELFQSSDLSGTDLGTPPARNYGQCMQACEDNNRCGGFTWVGSINPGRCFLKRGTELYPERSSRRGTASARKISRDIAPDFVQPVAPRN